MLRPDQRMACNQHPACIAVDYAKGEGDLDSKYVVLAMQCAELYDMNCLGLYISGNRDLFPGEEFSRRALANIIGSRHVKVR
jgi:hypothetical protein